VYSHGSFLLCVLQPQIKQLEQAVFIGESALGFGEFSKLAMHRFYGICGVNGLSDIDRVAQVSRQIFPFTPP